MTATRTITWTLRCDYERASINGPVRCGSHIDVEADALLMARQIARQGHSWRSHPNPWRDYCPGHDQDKRGNPIERGT